MPKNNDVQDNDQLIRQHLKEASSYILSNRADKMFLQKHLIFLAEVCLANGWQNTEYFIEKASEFLDLESKGKILEFSRNSRISKITNVLKTGE